MAAQDAPKTAAMIWAEALAVPITVAIIAATAGLWIASRDSEDRGLELDSTYAALAIEILQQEPPLAGAPNENDELAIRVWAIEVLAASSPVEIGPEIADTLRQNALTGGRTFVRIVELRDKDNQTLATSAKVKGGGCVTAVSIDNKTSQVCDDARALELNDKIDGFRGTCGQTVEVFEHLNFEGESELLDFCT